jgi:hypothetical protein
MPLVLQWEQGLCLRLGSHGGKIVGSITPGVPLPVHFHLKLAQLPSTGIGFARRDLAD